MDKDTIKLLLIVLIGSGSVNTVSSIFSQPLTFEKAQGLVNGAVTKATEQHNQDMIDCRRELTAAINSMGDSVKTVSDRQYSHETNQAIHRE